MVIINSDFFLIYLEEISTLAESSLRVRVVFSLPFNVEDSFVISCVPPKTRKFNFLENKALPLINLFLEV